MLRGVFNQKLILTPTRTQPVAAGKRHFEIRCAGA